MSDGRLRRVVSVSLGTSKRDKCHETEILGHPFRIERRGTDGSREKFVQLVRELDGQVDAIGIGGADLYVSTRKKRYTFRDVKALVKDVRRTPVVDGSGLKHTLERETIARLGLSGTVEWGSETALLVSAVDRFGMAQALDELCPRVIYGDLLFGLGLPFPVRKYRTVELLGGLLLPLVTLCPIQWFYPTGEKQEKRTPKFGHVFDEASVICGDWHYIRRYAPDRMPNKTVITQTVRAADVDWLRSTGVARLITTTPNMGGETFATNVLEGVIVSLLGRSPDAMSAEDYLGVLKQLAWEPHVVRF